MIKFYLFIYNLFQILALPVFFPFMAIYGLSKKKYKDHFLKRFGIGLKGLDSKRSKRIWIHCLSLGELNASKALIHTLKEKHPKWEIILSASTKSGLNELRRCYSKKKNIFICTLPFDFIPVVKRYVDFLKPDCFLLVETDIWPNLLWHLKSLNIPTFLINGSISKRSSKRLSRVPNLSTFLYGPFTGIFMQSQDDKKRLLDTGLRHEKIEVYGNIKFDLTLNAPTLQKKEQLLKRTGFPKDSIILIAGSTHEPEEKTMLKVFFKLKVKHENLGLIIAPRDVERYPDILKECKKLGLETRVRTNSISNSSRTTDVFLLNTLGELLSFYSISHIAFVGGSLVPIGGHNILEPAFFKIPVLFGPHMESFLEVARKFSKDGGGFWVKNQEDLFERLSLLIKDKKLREKMGEKGFLLIKKNQGAVKKYAKIIEAVLLDPKNAKRYNRKVI